MLHFFKHFESIVYWKREKILFLKEIDDQTNVLVVKSKVWAIMRKIVFYDVLIKSESIKKFYESNEVIGFDKSVN